jgi:DNA-binding GntR family transcriptional regulator
LVIVQSRAGYIASPVTLKDARDVCRVRAVLDGEAAASAAEYPERSERELRALDAIRESRTIAKMSSQELLQDDREFHRAIARIGENQRLVDVVDATLGQFLRLGYLSLALHPEVDFMRHDHSNLITALAAGDADRARALAREEVRAAESEILQALISSESVASAHVSAAPTANRFYLDVPKTTPQGDRPGGTR